MFSKMFSSLSLLGVIIFGTNPESDVLSQEDKIEKEERHSRFLRKE